MHIEKETIDQTVEALRALADPARLRLLRAVQSASGRVCVCELVAALALPQAQVSRHLGRLKRAGWLHSERHGTWAYYRLPDCLAPHRQRLLRAIEQFDETPFKADAQRLKRRLALREGGLCVLGYDSVFTQFSS